MLRCLAIVAATLKEKWMIKEVPLARLTAEGFAELGLGLKADSTARKTILALPTRCHPSRSCCLYRAFDTRASLCLTDPLDEIEAIPTAVKWRTAGSAAPPKTSVAMLLSAYADVRHRQPHASGCADDTFSSSS